MALDLSRPNTATSSTIIDLCEEHLKSVGFAHRKNTTLWRRSNVKFDVLKFEIIPKARCQKWKMPVGSLTLSPSAVFPFLPRLHHRERNSSVHPEDGFGQVRYSIQREIVEPILPATNIWWPGQNDPNLARLVLEDILIVLYGEVSAFFKRFENTEELLRTFVEDGDEIKPGGIWGFGKLQSATRLLFIGYAAMECKKWSLAVANFQACESKVRSSPQPVLAQVLADFLPLIEQGFTCAQLQRAWSSL